MESEYQNVGTMPQHVREYVRHIDGNGPFHHFEISRSVIQAADFSEVFATIKGLKEMGILRLPFPLISVGLNVADMLESPGWQPLSGVIQSCWQPGGRAERLNFKIEALLFDHIQMEGSKFKIPYQEEITTQDPGGQIMIYNFTKRMVGNGRVSVPFKSDETEMENLICRQVTAAGAILIAALATRNIVKHESVNSRADRGQARSKHRGLDNRTIFLSRTILEVPPIKLDHSEGKSPRPHMRRGHIHRFRHGKGRELVKSKWIPPMYVAADGRYTGANFYKV